MDPEIISRMTVNWSYKPIESVRDHYKEDYLIPIIEQYSRDYDYHCSYIQNNATLNVLLPIGALRCVHTLQEISHNQFLLLTADKAHSHEDDLKLTKENPHLVTHGSFSFMTNFHAIREYVEHNGGCSYHTPYYSGLQVAAFVMGSMKLPEFRFSWEVSGIVE